jgi:peptidoglycan-associated lipoprotein
MNSRFLQLAVLALMTLSLTACPNRNRQRTDEITPEDVQRPADQVQEPNMKVGPEYKEVPELQAVYFDLDQTNLRADARQTLQKNHDVLKSHPEWEALVEGHCDERGTTEYNLGLGQKRAASIRQYYMTLGLPGIRIATISYGKENPACSESNEDCWNKNRRGVTKVRALQTKGGGSSSSSSTGTPSGTTTGGSDNISIQ